jgi:peptide/nickel transport system substrate-binding protein
MSSLLRPRRLLNLGSLHRHAIGPFATLLVTLLVALCAPACSKSQAAAAGDDGSAGTRATRAETLIVARAQGPNSLDIHGVGTNNPAYEASWNVYDRLITYGEKRAPDGSLMYDHTQLRPELAERWQVSDDAITFELRANAVFHDGSPVSAEDVRWSYERALAMGGFPKFQMGAGSIEKPEQFEVVGPLTFRLKLLRKDKFTLPDLSVPVAAIYNKKLALRHATAQDPWAAEWLKMNTAASGAFRVESFEPGVSLSLVRNDAWTSGPAPRLKKVVVRVVPSASTRRAMIERGDVDLSYDLPPRDAVDLLASKEVKVEGVPVENFMWFLDMNTRLPPFDDLRVRQAIAAAVPYEALFSTTCFGRGKKLYGAASATPATIEWPQPYPFRTDLDRARALLAQSSQPNGFASKLYYNLGQATWSEPIALLVQENLAKIGITLTLEKVPAGNWRAEMGNKKMPFLVNDMGGWLNYPEYFFYWNYHGQNAVFNTMNYGDPQMDELIQAARFAPDAARYEASVKGFLKKAFDDVPRIPLYQANLDVALRPDIDGYHFWFHRQIDYRQLGRKAG